MEAGFESSELSWLGILIILNILVSALAVLIFILIHLKGPPYQMRDPGRRKSATKSILNPDWVCYDCGMRLGRRQYGDGQISTWHRGRCDICGKDAEVTQPRDFGGIVGEEIMREIESRPNRHFDGPDL